MIYLVKEKSIDIFAPVVDKLPEMDTAIEIRLASKRDCAIVSRWLKTSEHEDESRFSHNFDNRSQWTTVWVAKCDQKIVGFMAGVLRTEDDEAHAQPYLDIIVVRKKYRRHGIGESLTRHFIDLAKKSGPFGFIVICTSENSKSLCRKLGFFAICGYDDYPYRMAYVFESEKILRDGEGEETRVKISVSPRKDVPAVERVIDANRIGNVLYLKETFLAYADSDTRINISIDDKLLANPKAKYIEKIDGERANPFIRLNQIWLGDADTLSTDV